jgi:hypothetical protein
MAPPSCPVQTTSLCEYGTPPQEGSYRRSRAIELQSTAWRSRPTDHHRVRFGRPLSQNMGRRRLVRNIICCTCQLSYPSLFKVNLFLWQSIHSAITLFCTVSTARLPCKFFLHDWKTAGSQHHQSQRDDLYSGLSRCHHSHPPSSTYSPTGLFS